MEDPTPFGLCVGCHHETFECEMRGTPDGKAREVVYNCEALLKKCVERYLELAPLGTKLQTVPTPFTTSNNDAGVFAPSGPGEWLECPWCKGRFASTSFGHGRDATCLRDVRGIFPVETKEDLRRSSEANTGKLAKHAMAVLMSFLYPARIARFDLLRAISGLATRVTTWDTTCDKRLYRVVCYVNSTLHWRQFGYIGDPTAKLRVHLYSDADFAGCKNTARSTTGVHLALEGAHSSWPAAHGHLQETGLREPLHTRSRTGRSSMGAPT